jgi:hypothetical protein
MIWMLVIAATVNGPGAEAARFDSYKECDIAATIISSMAHNNAIKERGESAAADIYARCERRSE